MSSVEISTSHTFEVPLLPPSVNHYKKVRWQHQGNQFMGFYTTAEAKAFIEAVCILSGRQAVSGRYFHVAITFHIPIHEFLRWDVDNFSKVSCDALKAAGLIPDDRYIAELSLVKRPTEATQDARTVYFVHGRESL